MLGFAIVTEPMGKPPLALDKYATLHAEIDAGAEVDAVLDRELLPKEVWLAAQAYWLKRMADEAHRKRFETTTRYQALFTAKRKVFQARFERDKKRRERPPIAAPPVELLAAAEAELAVPLRASPRAMDVPAPPVTSAVTSPVTARDPVAFGGSALMPFAPPTFAAPVPASAFSAPAPAFSAPALSAPAPAFVAPVSPPQPPVAPVASPQTPVAAPKPKPKMNATMAIPLDAILSSIATPFKPKDTASSVPQTEPRAQQAPEKPAAATVGAPRRDLSATWCDSGAPSKQDTLPFRTPGAGARVSFPEAGDAKPKSIVGDDDSPKTVTFDLSNIPGAPLSALPFGGADGARSAAPAPVSLQTAPKAPASSPGSSSPAKSRRFSINVFASLTAEIAESPQDTEAIRTRYGVSEAEHHEESLRWTEEFQRSDETRQRYFGIVQRYRGYIQQRKRT